MQTWSSAWGEQPIEHADEVTLSRKGAKSQRRITGLRSKATKARTHVDRVREPRAELKKELEARTRELAEAVDQQTATSEILSVICSTRSSRVLLVFARRWMPGSCFATAMS
jgi:beta-phosphoglucomutase-like phosphatase (HAD superfamily)